LGRALKFYSSIRLDIRKSEAIKNSASVIIGNKTKVKVVKNKMAPPFAIAEFDIIFGEGISYTGELVDLGVKYDVVEKAGSWYSYEGEKLGQGRDNAKIAIKGNEKLGIEIREKINKAIRKEKGIDDEPVVEKSTDKKAKNASTLNDELT
jgi:recombination protein RecA